MPPPNNLPQQLTSFVGREREVADIIRLLASARLLTLTGAGGSGKTRLAHAVAAELLTHFEDGVFFVSLAPIRDPALVVSAIAQLLGAKETAGQTLLDTLKTFLGEKRMLLVLDNFEQVVTAATEVGQLLISCSQLKILVTSRVPLRIRGEKEYAVTPLELPDLVHLPSLEKLTQYESVRLFTERATDVKSDFEVNDGNAPTVAEICTRLDGLPLAIELAAAHVKMLPPHALLSRLSRRLKLLTGGARDLPGRQQTLRDAIDWSYDLLDEGHKEFFRRMAPFMGGQTLAALEAVCNYDGKLRVDVFAGTETLHSNSLLQQREGSDGEARFWMLETIHEYAQEKLEESGEGEALEKEHALHFMRLAEEAEPHLTGAKQVEWLNRLTEEHANLRHALNWAREQAEKGDSGAVEIGLRTAGALVRFWSVRGYYSEGREAMGRLLSATAPLDLPRFSMQGRAKALSGAAFLAWRQGELAVARTTAEEALDIGRGVGDKQNIALSLNVAGLAAYDQDEYTAAQLLFEESLLLRRELADKSGISVSLNNLGNVARVQGDYQMAQVLFEESLAMAQQSGDKGGRAGVLSNLGLVVAYQGIYQRAHALQEESLLLRRELGDKLGIASSLNRLSNVALLEGDYAVARALQEGSLVIVQELEDRGWGTAGSLGNLGNIAFMQEDYTQARFLYRQSLTIYKELADKGNCAWSIAELGAVAALTGHEEQGARMMAAAEALFELIGGVLGPVNQLPYERGLAFARARLGEEAFEKARAEGQTLTMEQAIELALSDLPEPELVQSSLPAQPYPNDLTIREVEVLRLIAQGLTNQQIAERLFLSRNTVHAHLHTIYGKLDVTTRNAAAHFAVSHNLT